jgi:peptidoglycan/LPS O-acetylase OafA/YrhL
MQYRFFDKPVDQIRSAGLDKLRFLLALWVLLAHAIGWGVYTGALNSDGVPSQIGRAFIWIFQRDGETHPAVLAFIVLSGYCIHRNGFRINRAFLLTAYGVRRFFRIFPVYFLASLLGMVFWFDGVNANALATKALTGTDSITLWGMFIKLTGLSSFVPSLHTTGWQGNAPLTTAIVEAWLYIFYGFVAWFVARGSSVRALVFGAVLIWTITLWYVYLNPKYLGWWHNGSFISFAFYWWIGAVLAETQPPRAEKFYAIAVSISLCLIGIGSLGGDVVLVELRKIGLVVFFGSLIQWVDQNWRSESALAKAGLAGYCIYALHAPLLIILLINGLSLIFAVSTVLMASMLCHLAFERPLLEFGKRLSVRAAH